MHRFAWELKDKGELRAMSYQFQYDFNFQARIDYWLSVECVMSSGHGLFNDNTASASQDVKIGVIMNVPENKPISNRFDLLEQVHFDVSIPKQVAHIGDNLYVELSVTNQLKRDIKVKVSLRSEVTLSDGSYGHPISQSVKSVGMPLIGKGEDLMNYRLTIPTNGLHMWPSMVLNSGNAQRIVQSYCLCVAVRTAKVWKVPFSEHVDCKEFKIVICGTANKNT